MDSGNSGSLQSSSGGDEEYDSRTESISSFLNPSHHHHQQQHQIHPPSSAMFDPLSNYLDSFSRSAAPPPPRASSSLLNLDMVWSRGLRSEPTCTEIPTGGGLMGSSSSAQPASGGQVSTFQGLSKPSASSSSDKTNPLNSVRSNSKKRSRASRRAPTTVLTTDTSNFRAMVQEFTGIPAPPFSASPFPRNRFDLFNTSSTTMRSNHLESPLPHYLLRPFAQKFHPPSPSSIPSTTNPTGTTSGAAISIAGGSSNNHQLLSDLGLTKQTPHHQSLLNMQNPMFTFQSLLQSSGPPPPAPPPPPRYPLANAPVFTMGGHGLPSLVTSDHGISLRNDDSNNNNNNNNNPSSWGDGIGLNEGDQSEAHLKSVNGNCKMNYSSTSSLEFQVEKGSENVSSRGEGMVDSWIFSSD